MANFSLRLMIVFLISALVINISNYLFVRVYNASRLSPYRTLRATLSPNYWSTLLECGDKNTSYSNDSRRNNYSVLDLSTYSAYYLISTNPHTTARQEMENCPELPPGLGPELVDRPPKATNLQYYKIKLNDVQPGGVYQPTNCKSLQSVAVIIAYRGCKNYLTTFLNILHPILMKQQLDYQIFVVEQSNKTQPYNRGKLLNVGFSVASRSRKDGFRCIIIHEPHIVPMDSRNLYRCSWYPRQLATVVERPVKTPYQPLLGGAIAMTPEQFLTFNGFSNAYWGNDADYYDLYQRSEYLATPSPLYLLDGLSSLSYSVVKFELRRLFTYLQVNIDTLVETESKAKMYNILLNPDTYKTTQQLKQYDTTLNK